MLYFFLSFVQNNIIEEFKYAKTKYAINDRLNESFFDPISNPCNIKKYSSIRKSIRVYTCIEITARIHGTNKLSISVICDVQNVHQLGQWSLRSTPRTRLPMCQSVNTSCRIKRFNALHTRSWSRWSSKQTIPSRLLCLYTAALIAFKCYLHLVDSREKFIDTDWSEICWTRWYSPLKLAIHVKN